MAHIAILFQNVTFTYEKAVAPLIRNFSASFLKGWTGITGANGSGKSTLLKLSTRDLAPIDGSVSGPGHAIYCPQRTDDAPTRLPELIDALDAYSHEIKGRLGIADDWLRRWNTLSHGERKRAQIAVSLWLEPEILAIDEPTNHIDAEAKGLLFDALSRFKGIGLLVSHDRELLDGLCRQCVFMEPPEAILRPGTYTEGYQQAAKEALAQHRQRAKAQHEVARLKKETVKRREASSRSHRERSKRGLALKDHDARFKKNIARYTGKDGEAGKRLRQISGRFSQAQRELDRIKVRKTYEMGIWMPSEKSRRRYLFSLPSGTLSLGSNRQLRFPELPMKADDRIAITGVNGSGKSTLVQHIMLSSSLDRDKVVYLPQQIDLTASQEIMDRARNLPDTELGQMMTIVSRLGSRPRRLLESTTPSPGEIRKVLLATGIAKLPHLIVMDEPTNHLDLPSIECLESALMDCPCGLLLVSHDRRFLESLTRRRWHISEKSIGKGHFVLSQV